MHQVNLDDRIYEERGAEPRPPDFRVSTTMLPTCWPATSSSMTKISAISSRPSAWL